MKHIQTFDSFLNEQTLNEGKAEPLFKKGDEVVIGQVGGSAKKYAGKDGVISSAAMSYSNGKYSYMVKVGRTEIEFDEIELNSKS